MSPSALLTKPAPSMDMKQTPPETSHASLQQKHVHFVGIGGCGMSGLARIARRHGALCTGSDLASSSTIQALRSEGIPVALEQTAASVPVDAQLLVISAAIRDEHPECVEARRRGIPILKYAQMLGSLMVGRNAVAVAGTHGKSSTTSMLSHVLISAGLDPSVIVGANCQQIGGGARTGQSNILVAEACEFDRSFHNFHPTHSIILNIEEDHLDTYGSLAAIIESFAIFARKLPEHGSLLINHEMPSRLAVCAGLRCKVETLGFSPQADWHVQVLDPLLMPAQAQQNPAAVRGLEPATSAAPLVRLLHRGELVSQWRSPLPGEHMAYNAAAAAITAHRLGASWDAIVPALESFQGLDRRMQLMGRHRVPGGFITVVDDYGHHPTEVDTTLRALRRHYRPRRLLCIFQPHQHSRTKFLMEQFAVSFSEADVVIVPPIYFVRDSEKERHAVQAGDLVDRLRQRGKHAMHLYPFGAIVEQLQMMAREGDLIVTMGAGDVWKIAAEFLEVIR